MFWYDSGVTLVTSSTWWHLIHEQNAYNWKQ